MVKSKHIGFRLSSKNVALLKKICRMRGEDMSDFVRRAIRKELGNLNYLDKEEKKALGL